MIPPDCESYIVRRFHQWCKQNKKREPSGNDAFAFYTEIETSESGYLKYNCPKRPAWDTVHGWLKPLLKDDKHLL